VGNNTYAFGRYFEPEHQTVLMSGYLGSIGFSFPAALGAWAATQEPDTPFAGRNVVSVSSDGGFGQYMSEFTTAVKYDMDITHVLLNDDELGKISKEQRTGGWDVWQTDLVNPDFAAFAENAGGYGVSVADESELDDALEAAIAYDGPSLIEIPTDSEPV
jgi:thiamine pyrophosphate-dependent acetolactate synthase large subunit-like protein